MSSPDSCDHRLFRTHEPLQSLVTRRVRLEYSRYRTASREQIEANADLFDFELPPEEMRAVFELDGGPSDRLAGQLQPE